MATKKKTAKKKVSVKKPARKKSPRVCKGNPPSKKRSDPPVQAAPVTETDDGCRSDDISED